MENENVTITIENRREKAQPYLKKYNKAKNFNSSRQDAYAELMAFYQGNQHLLSKYKNKKPWVINMNTPYASVAIDNRVASLLATDYIGEILPLSPEDTQSIEALNSFQQKEWKRMEIDKIVKDSIRLGAVIREAYCHIVVNKHKTIGGSSSKRMGALEAYLIEPSCIYIDPNARCLKDAGYMFVTGRINKDEALEKYSFLKDENFSDDTANPSDRGEVYVDNDYTTEQDDVLTKITCYTKKGGKIERVLIIGGIFIEESFIDIDVFPIAQYRWKPANQSCYGLSLMDEVLSLQKAVTSIESAVTNTAIAYAAPSMMVRKGCGIDPNVASKAVGAPGVVYAVDGDLSNAMKPVVPPQISGDIVNIKADYQNQINSVTGNSQQFLGNIGSAGNTNGGTEKAINRATIIEQYALNNIKEYVKDITDILVKFIIKLYAGKEVTYYNGKNGKGDYQFDKIKLPSSKKLSDIDYSYYIELENKTPYSKEKQKEELLEIFQIERQYDVPIKTVTVGDIIKNSALENKEEIIERFNELAYQDAETKAQTILDLSQQAISMGIPSELVTQAVSEIIGGAKDTPAVDALMKEIEDKFKQQMEKEQQMLQESQGLQEQGVNASPEAIAMAQQMMEGGM